MRLSVRVALAIVLLLVGTIPIAQRVETFVERATPLATPQDVLVINLDRRLDRRRNFERAYAQSDIVNSLALHRIPAVDGQTVDPTKYLTPQAYAELQDYLRIKARRKHSQLTPGAIGCYLSHMRAWEYVVKQNRPYLICEDDAIIPKDFGAHLKKALALLPAVRPETLIFFHILCDERYDRDLKCERIEGIPNAFRAVNFWSMACYYITPASARALLARSVPMAAQVDIAIAEWGRLGVVQNFAYPVVQTWNEGGTDIQAPLLQTGGR